MVGSALGVLGEDEHFESILLGAELCKGTRVDEGRLVKKLSPQPRQQSVGRCRLSKRAAVRVATSLSVSGEGTSPTTLESKAGLVIICRAWTACSALAASGGSHEIFK